MVSNTVASVLRSTLQQVVNAAIERAEQEHLDAAELSHPASSTDVAAEAASEPQQSRGPTPSNESTAIAAQSVPYQQDEAATVAAAAETTTTTAAVPRHHAQLQRREQEPADPSTAAPGSPDVDGAAAAAAGAELETEGSTAQRQTAAAAAAASTSAGAEKIESAMRMFLARRGWPVLQAHLAKLKKVRAHLRRLSLSTALELGLNDFVDATAGNDDNGDGGEDNDDKSRARASTDGGGANRNNISSRRRRAKTADEAIFFVDESMSKLNELQQAVRSAVHDGLERNNKLVQKAEAVVRSCGGCGVVGS